MKERLKFFFYYNEDRGNNSDEHFKYGYERKFK